MSNTEGCEIDLQHEIDLLLNGQSDEVELEAVLSRLCDTALEDTANQPPSSDNDKALWMKKYDQEYRKRKEYESLMSVLESKLQQSKVDALPFSAQQPNCRPMKTVGKVEESLVLGQVAEELGEGFTDFGVGMRSEDFKRFEEESEELR